MCAVTPLVVFTIGHSTRTLDELIALLRAHGVRRLVDVSTMPRSRRHPHFNREALEASLPAAGVVYRHEPALGGLRRPRGDSVNTGWRHEAFRGYADYMESEPFWSAVDRLIEEARSEPTAIMCAEALWWRCHRQLIADALTIRGVDVRHIGTSAAAAAHRLSTFASQANGRLTYPGNQKPEEGV